MTSKGPLNGSNDLPTDFGIFVACFDDSRHPHCSSESLRDAGLLPRIVCVILGCVLLAVLLLTMVLGPDFLNVFLN